ncbi:glycoside hydrolase family 3 protein [Lutimonas vermicola]|uniref:beta-glucosidase n=1 Tax=Lutimonas vermicola TaxID=414288 RepID=A0ABU9L575_9FLAO
MIQKKVYLGIVIAGFLMNSCVPKFTEENNGDFITVKNESGKVLGYHPDSGVSLLTKDRYAFKDLNKNGKLDTYEDWRLPAEERAADLASKMSVEQIAGLMLYSGHQSIPSSGGFRGPSYYNGKPFDESGASPGDLSDEQKKFLKEDHLRHVLIRSFSSPSIAAQWNNNAQAMVESIGLGIPVNSSSDPRHGSDSYAEFNASGGDLSVWPSTLGIAASFDPDLMYEFGKIGSQEYRALGIATALSPQIDLGTEPRWYRFDGTMGEDPDLTTDMARAYIDGFQSTDTEGSDGWGTQSVNTMVKHWPGGGTGESGRDAHYGYGAYGVYPGKNLKQQIQPFSEGAFKLKGQTKMASAVMPYYTISYDQDSVIGENVANAYNKYLITDLLRGTYGYEDVICTDWRVTGDVNSLDQFQGKPWGVEHLTVAERHYKALEAGVDQFGGNNEKAPVLEAYNMGVKERGEAYMRERFEASAVRLLKNIFRVGLFENPYLDIAVTDRIVGSETFKKAGFEAQLRSIILLKNHKKTLPLQAQQKVYIPVRYIAASKDWFGNEIPEKWEMPFNLEVVKRYFDVVEDPDAADFALVGISNPDTGVGYDRNDLDNGGNGYVPISLQYGTYTAHEAREVSMAGGSPLENFTNRSYKGKSIIATNISDMKMVLETRKKMGDKPVIVSIRVSKPMVFSEIEPDASAILIHMGVQDKALLDIISGNTEPSALLPFQMPADMNTVETQFEDVPRDMKPYVDSEGNTYDFAFGLNWQGVITDERVEKYR